MGLSRRVQTFDLYSGGTWFDAGAVDIESLNALGTNLTVGYIKHVRSGSNASYLY
jgi:hypothetical protein